MNDAVHSSGGRTVDSTTATVTYRYNQASHVAEVSNVLCADQRQQDEVVLLALVPIHCGHRLGATKEGNAPAPLHTNTQHRDVMTAADTCRTNRTTS